MTLKLRTVIHLIAASYGVKHSCPSYRSCVTKSTMSLNLNFDRAKPKLTFVSAKPDFDRAKPKGTSHLKFNLKS